MIVTMPQIKGSVDVDTFADITSTVVEDVRWNEVGHLDITFASDLTAQERMLVRIRCLAENAAEETLLRQAWQAVAANQQYLALSPPTTAQVVAQVDALTRQVNGIIRRIVADF